MTANEDDAVDVIADALLTFWSDGAGSTRAQEASAIVSALRAAGLLPGPDDIVVSREALDHVWLCAGGPGYCDLCDKIRAALSQPHPAQEQQT